MTGGSRKRDVHDRALGLLAVRARSRRELQQRLSRAGFEPTEIEDTLARLEAVGLVDDEAFARQIAGHEMSSRGSGRRAVQSALYAKGVARETIELVLSEIATEEGGEFERALSLARSRVGRLARGDRAAAYRKLFSFLGRRGYPPSIAREAAMRALDLNDEEDAHLPRASDRRLREHS